MTGKRSDIFLNVQPGGPLPVDIYGDDQTGHFVDVRELRGEGDVLVYLYPFDGENTHGGAPPATLRQIEERLPELERLGAKVVGLRGPPSATTGASLESVPFPLIEDTDYEIAQALGAFGRSARRETPRRAIVLLDAQGRVKGVWPDRDNEPVLDLVVEAMQTPQGP